MIKIVCRLKSIAIIKNEFNLICVLQTQANVACDGDFDAALLFDLTSNDSHIHDDLGKDLDTLHDAYEHARRLVDKILFHVGHDDAEAWKIIVLNDMHNAQMIIPFAVSNAFRAQRQKRDNRK